MWVNIITTSEKKKGIRWAHTCARNAVHLWRITVTRSIVNALRVEYMTKTYVLAVVERTGIVSTTSRGIGDAAQDKLQRGEYKIANYRVIYRTQALQLG